MAETNIDPLGRKTKQRFPDLAEGVKLASILDAQNPATKRPKGRKVS